FMLFGALLAANEHELVFTRMGPGFGWELHWKMAYVAGFLLIMLATRLIRLLYPQEARTHVDAAALVIAGAGVLLALLTPARIFILVQPAFYLISALTVLYCIETGMRAAKRNLPHAWMVVVSGMAVTIWLESEWRHYYGTPGPKNTATGFVAALAATFGMAVMHLFDHTRLSKTATSLVGENNALNARLSEQVAELQAARELLSAQEEEMHRKTAEFLQSRVQSKLLVVGHHLDEARKWLQTAPEKGRRELETAQSQIEDIRENDVRLVSHLLHPTVISLGLGTAVRSLASEFSQQLHVVIDMKPEVAALDSVAGSSIPERVRLAAYRVLAETLGNARAHAQATAVRIRLSLTPTGDLAIEVADDGIGFDPGSITTGLGLRTMAARLAECDGSLACDSRPGKGTCIRVRIPLPEPEAASKD
ncbi:MAG TPA: ATP-binding protein, partial [Symbiobacteriaceae bacterium]|nr:ATP-binding protein [Symbiobacteriaceae bacterium]